MHIGNNLMRHRQDVHFWTCYSRDYKAIHKGGHQDFKMPRWGMAQNKLGTTDINDLLKELLNYLLY